MEKNKKTNHQTGWHKKVVNPTLNHPKDTHKEFCRRCLSANSGLCPDTNGLPKRSCTL